MEGDQRGDKGIHQPFRHLIASGIENGRVGHQVADIAQQQQRATVEADRTTGTGGILTVGIQATLNGLATLLEGVGQGAFDQAQPVAIGQHLVLGIDGGNAVLKVENGRHGAFQHEVGDTGLVILADRVSAVDADVDMQAVMLQQDRGRIGSITLIAFELGRAGQRGLLVAQSNHHRITADAQFGRISPVTAFQRGVFVQKVTGPGDNLGTTGRVVTPGTFCAAFLADGIGAIERVIEATPAGIGSVEGITGIEDWHHQLWTGNLGDFRVGIGGGDCEFVAFRDQIADLGQEFLIGTHIADRAGIGAVVFVDLGLQRITLGEQGAVLRGQCVKPRGKAVPECILIDTGAGNCFVIDEIDQFLGHLIAVYVHACGHGKSSRYV